MRVVCCWWCLVLFVVCGSFVMFMMCCWCLMRFSVVWGVLVCCLYMCRIMLFLILLFWLRCLVVVF